MKLVSDLPGIQKINNPERNHRRILVAPLDWGLGHATRCIPIIKILIERDCEVWVAASGDQKMLLQNEFPSLSFIELPGYDIKYGKNRAFTKLQIASAIPRILTRIRQENRLLKHWIRDLQINAVIADNRYGLYAPDIPTVFITHQLAIQTGMGPLANALLQRLNYSFISRFRYCWIPDWANEPGLAGILSHPRRFPKSHVQYIGPLSRFQHTAQTTPSQPQPADPTHPDLLILLSGPEPQRTIFENLILPQLHNLPGNTILVRGKPGLAATPSPAKSDEPTTPNTIPRSHTAACPVTPNLTTSLIIHNHLPSSQLAPLLQNASLILSRAGYSTIMDLACLHKKAILVPTPGQTEQEYLGTLLHQHQKALSFLQKNFSVKEALNQASLFPYKEFYPENNSKNQPPANSLESAINQLLSSIQSPLPDLG